MLVLAAVSVGGTTASRGPLAWRSADRSMGGSSPMVLQDARWSTRTDDVQLRLRAASARVTRPDLGPFAVGWEPGIELRDVELELDVDRVKTHVTARRGRIAETVWSLSGEVHGRGGTGAELRCDTLAVDPSTGRCEPAGDIDYVWPDGILGARSALTLLDGRLVPVQSPR